LRRKFKWSSKLLPKRNRKPDAPTGKQTSPELSKIQKNIYRQATLAGLTIVLTIVILFAMTSAWYTNIVQTSGLVFEAEPWGFDGTITVENDPVQAAPGDEGVISMVVQNGSESLSTLSVNISKADMNTQEMQKRLFFYVDTHMTREKETMDRVYINNFEGYNYTVFGKGQLTLTEEISNAPQIKWQWVYDMLGYYVMANPIKDASGNITTMAVQDYLRPIEYNYDEATITYSTDADGNETADITAMEGMNWKDFLVSVSEKDGYPGKIDPSKAVNVAGKDYYPVDVEPDGSGVYAYLCSYSEVEWATDYDTSLGVIAHEKAKAEANNETIPPEDLKRIQNMATIRISAQNSDSTVVSVGTLTGLNKAIEDGMADVIQLSSGITLTEANPLVIPANTRTTIDLNGNTITGTNANGASIVASQGSSLTLTNGTITGQNAGNGKGRGIETTGAEVIMSDITMTGFDNGVYMGDHNKVDNKENELDSRVHMVNCNIDANWYGVFINGNGTNSEQKTQLIIEDSTISGDGYGITGSGNTNRSGTDIQISHSTIQQIPENGGTGAAIFHPQSDSTLTIADESTIEGYTGIALKGGHATISDATVTGYGVQHEDPKTYATKSGFADTADAVYIETNYEYDISLRITNSTLTCTESAAQEAQSLRVYEEDAANVIIEIISGTFDQKQNEKYLAEGSAQKQDNKKYVVTAAD